MGKPSSTQLSKKSSVHSDKLNMSKDYIPVKISKRRRRQRQCKKTQSTISKLFQHLRETSVHDLENNVINIDDTVDTNTENSLIIIPDDEHNACSTPKKELLHHSASLTLKQEKLDELILAQSNNNLTALHNANVTREINKDSYLTIDLTTETLNNTEPTVIDLENTTGQELTVVDASCGSSMSGDSNVTVLRQPVNNQISKLTKKGIASLNAEEKGRLLEIITETIFNGCNVQSSEQNNLSKIKKSIPRVPDTAEDTYIKEVILGGKQSRCSTGSNVYHPDRQRMQKSGLRMIVIDGSNVAMQHTRGKTFSVRGLQICIDYFLRKGHVVKAFVPQFRCKRGMSTDGKLLDHLERNGLVIYTPSREVHGRKITPYDDRYIIQCAAEFDGVIVSCDNYRDLINENPKWRFVIENRVLPFTWVDDMIMFPRDPLGRNGPTLEQFLRHNSNDKVITIF